MASRMRGNEEGQVGVLALVLSLLIVGLLTAIVLGTTLGNGSNGTSGNPDVGLAGDVQAKTNLSQAVSAAQQALAAGGGVSEASLSAADPALQYTSGASTAPNVISVATAAGSAGTGGAIPGAGGVTVPGAGGVTVPGAGGGALPGASATGGSAVVLAVQRRPGNCWFAYLGGGAVWNGEQTGQSSCTAPALSSPPTAGAVSSSAIGWQQGAPPP